MIINLLKSSPLFNDFSNSELEELINSNTIQQIKHKKGQTIHTNGEPCTRIDILLTGTLTAYSLSENGSAISIFNFSENSILGCNLLFSDINKYPLNIYCTNDCHICYINKDNLSKLLSINDKFMMKFIKVISNLSTNMNSKILTFSSPTLRHRILNYLNKEATIQKSKRIKLTITKKQLADELGVQRPSLFRELKKMKDEHLLDYDSNYITLKTHL